MHWSRDGVHYSGVTFGFTGLTGEIVLPPSGGGDFAAVLIGACSNAPAPGPFCQVTVSVTITPTTLLQITITSTSTSLRLLDGATSTLVYDTAAGSASRLRKRSFAVSAVTGSASPPSIALNYVPPATLAAWSTLGEGAGATLTFTWASPVQIAKVTLADRPNLDDNIVAGTLHFSDGQFVNVPELPNDGTPLPLYFSPITTSSLVFVVTSVSETSKNIGLSEMGVFSLLTSPSASGLGPVNLARYTSASGHSAKYQGAAKAIDGVSVVPTTGFAL
ncbi:hypothetical protein RQP46_007401 [Phenoliferia psychrophenolica]